MNREVVAMGAGRVFRGIVWRYCVWGLLAGAVLGQGYGAVVGVVGSLVDGTARVDRIAGLTLFCAFFGLCFGATAGAVLGLVDGLAIGVLTRVRHLPLIDARRYRREAAIVGVTPPLALLVALVFAAGPSADADVLVFFILPVVVAAASVAWVGRRIGAWYERASGGADPGDGPLASLARHLR